MAYVNLDKMSVNEIKVYVAELEAKIKVYETVIANSNFRAIIARPDEDKPKYSRPYKGRNGFKTQEGIVTPINSDYTTKPETEE